MIEFFKNKKVICFGELLWDIVGDSKESPGGAPMNVAYHLKKNNVKPLIITRIGDDRRGREIKAILDKWKVDTHNCQIDFINPTGIAHAVCNADEVSYDFPHPSAWDFIENNPENLALAKDSIFIFGSLVSRNSVSENTLLNFLKVASYKIFDVNLRKPFYSAEKISELLHYTDLLKVNENEIEILRQWFFQEINMVEKVVEALFQRFPINEIIITKGKNGSSYCDRAGKVAHFEAVSVKIVADTIGSGDSFLAGFLSCRMSGGTVEIAMQKASLLAAFVTSQYGAWPDYSLDEVEHFPQ